MKGREGAGKPRCRKITDYSNKIEITPWESSVRLQWKKKGRIASHNYFMAQKYSNKVHLFSTMPKLIVLLHKGMLRDTWSIPLHFLLHASEDGISRKEAQVSVHIWHTWTTTYMIYPGKTVIWYASFTCICRDNFYVVWLLLFFPSEIWSAIEAIKQINDLGKHTSDNLNK